MSAPFSPLDPITGLLPKEQMTFLGEPFTTTEARAAGMSSDVLTQLVRNGAVRRVLRGVYVDSASADCLESRTSALAKVVPTNSVVCDRTAAWLHGADILGPDGRVTVPSLQVFRILGGTRVRRAKCIGGTRILDVDRDIMKVGGVLVTTPLRTALDLGRLLRRGDAIGALDSLMRVGGLTADDLRTELPRFKGARWVTQLRTLIPLTDPRAESPAESLTRLSLIDAGLSAPEVQWCVYNELGVLIYRLDLAYPALMLAIEYDGEQFHGTAEQREHDRRRRERLRQMGWTIIVLKATDVYGANPTVASKVRAAVLALGSL